MYDGCYDGILAAHYIQREPLRTVAIGLAIGIGRAGCMDSDAQRQGVAQKNYESCLPPSDPTERGVYGQPWNSELTRSNCAGAYK